MSRKRGERGSGADLYAARQNAVVDPVESDEPDDIVVVDEDPAEVEDDPLPVDTGDGEADEHEDEPEDDGEQLTTMQRQLDELKARNAALEKRAEDSETDTVISQSAVLKQALAGAKQRAIDAENEIAVASAAGDHVAIAKATAKLSKAIQDQDRFELADDELSAEIEERKRAPKTKQPAAADADPYASSIKEFTEPSRQWLLKHRKHIEGNQRAGMKAQGLAQLAMAEGIQVDTPEFFDYLDKGMGFAEVPTKRAKPAAARPQTAAPTGSRGGGGKPTEIMLTAAQRKMAVDMGMTVKEYAKNLMEIEKNGKDPNRPGLRFSAHTAHSSRR